MSMLNFMRVAWLFGFCTWLNWWVGTRPPPQSCWVEACATHPASRFVFVFCACVCACEWLFYACCVLLVCVWCHHVSSKVCKSHFSSLSAARWERCPTSR
jgi:hypothetical protein